MQLIVDRIEVLFWISYIYLVKLWLVRNMNISVVFRLSVMVYDVNGGKSGLLISSMEIIIRQTRFASSTSLIVQIQIFEMHVYFFAAETKVGKIRYTMFIDIGSIC